MTKHEETAKRLIEKIYKDAGYHPQVDNFINAVAAALAQAEAEGAERVIEASLGCADTQDAEIARLKAENLRLSHEGLLVEKQAAEAERDYFQSKLAEAERERDELRLRINTLLEDISRAIAERDALWESMECGHPDACYSYLGPSDNNPAPDEKLPKPCLACRYGDAAEARGVRMGLERARRALDAEIAKAEGKSPA